MYHCCWRTDFCDPPWLGYQADLAISSASLQAENSALALENESQREQYERCLDKVGFYCSKKYVSWRAGVEGW